MFRFFENLVAPYVDYEEVDSPPPRLWPIMLGYSQYMGRLGDLLPEGATAFWQNHGAELIFVALFIVLVRPAVHLVAVLLLNNMLMTNFGTMIRWRAHRHVLRQSVGWFENDFAGRIANRVMQTPTAANEVMFQVFDAIAFAIAYLVGAAVLLAAADPWLLDPLAFWSIAYFALMVWTVKRVGPASQASSDARSTLTGRVVDSYTNIHSVKMFAHHDRELSYAKDAIEETRMTVRKEMRIYTFMDFGLFTLNGLLIVGVVGWAILLWGQSVVSVGAVAAATALCLRLNAMTGWIMWALTTFFRELGVVAEGMETIAQPSDLVDDKDAKDLDLTDGLIEIDGLSHHYGRGAGGRDRISLTIKPGEKIGLIGRSGAGKSTLVKLLLRFYAAETGRILIDGQDIAHVTQESLRRQIGMVQQDSSLLHRSVRDNVIYGRPDATDEEIFDAARKASAHDFILQLEDPKGRTGYDAHVGERGVKLSGGQRQRVMLARVMLKDAPILLLDEATSALDSEAEAQIQEVLYGMMEGKTVIAIAHRLSTIAQMDRILVMDEGRIAEEGSHDELLAQDGLYAQFWARQSGGFLMTDDKTEAAE